MSGCVKSKAFAVFIAALLVSCFAVPAFRGMAFAAELPTDESSAGAGSGSTTSQDPTGQYPTNQQPSNPTVEDPTGAATKPPEYQIITPGEEGTLVTPITTPESTSSMPSTTPSENADVGSTPAPEASTAPQPAQSAEPTATSTIAAGDSTPLASTPAPDAGAKTEGGIKQAGSGFPVIPVAVGGIVLIAVGLVFGFSKMKAGAVAAGAAGLSTGAATSSTLNEIGNLKSMGKSASEASVNTSGSKNLGMPSFDDKIVLMYMEDSEYGTDFKKLLEMQPFLDARPIEFGNDEELLDKCNKNTDLVVMGIAEGFSVSDAQSLFEKICSKDEDVDPKFAIALPAQFASCEKEVSALREEGTLMAYVTEEMSSKEALMTLIIPLYKPEATADEAAAFATNIASVLCIPVISDASTVSAVSKKASKHARKTKDFLEKKMDED